MSLDLLASDHQRARIRVTEQLSSLLRTQWRRIDRSDFDASLGLILPSITAAVTSAQVAAAEQAQDFIEQVDAYYGESSPAQLEPAAFAGVDWSGNLLAPAMLYASTIMKQRVARGYAPERAIESGFTYATATANTAVMDIGREADRVARIQRPVYQDYVRQIQPGACSRCIVLAGKSSAQRAFARHPRCRCIAIPVRETYDGAMDTDPQAFFESMSREDQDRTFTKAGAEAIRNGADIGRVVNARRGASGIQYGPRVLQGDQPRRMQRTKIGEYQGKPIYVYQTSELTGKRARKTYKYGSIDRRLPQGVRLMPETIIKLARGNQQELEKLLRHYGYIV